MKRNSEIDEIYVYRSNHPKSKHKSDLKYAYNRIKNELLMCDYEPITKITDIELTHESGLGAKNIVLKLIYNVMIYCMLKLKQRRLKLNDIDELNRVDSKGLFKIGDGNEECYYNFLINAKYEEFNKCDLVLRSEYKTVHSINLTEDAVKSIINKSVYFVDLLDHILILFYFISNNINMLTKMNISLNPLFNSNDLIYVDKEIQFLSIEKDILKDIKEKLMFDMAFKEYMKLLRSDTEGETIDSMIRNNIEVKDLQYCKCETPPDLGQPPMWMEAMRKAMAVCPYCQNWNTQYNRYRDFELAHQDNRLIDEANLLATKIYNDMNENEKRIALATRMISYLENSSLLEKRKLSFDISIERYIKLVEI